jgi:hypothetical protein
LRDVTTSMEDEAQSRDTDEREDGEEPLREGEVDLAILNGLAQL